MTYQSKPKKKSNYPASLECFEKGRKNNWIKAKIGFNQNISVKAFDSKRLQMFSGKRGK